MNPNDPNNPNPAPSGNPTPPAQPAAGVSLEQFNQLKDVVQQMSTFVEDASFIISGIYKDPELRAAVGAKFGQPGGQPPANPPQNPPQNPPANQPANPPQNPPAATFVTDARIDDVDINARQDIISRVEAKYGYANLPPDQRKALRQRVEKRLNQWNGSVRTTPVTQLTSVLEDAYVLENLSSAKSEGKLEGLVTARENAMGAFPSMGNQTPAPENTTLNADQQKWTDRWGLNPDKVTDRLKEFESDGVARYKPPTPQNNVPQNPAPSGNPTPPSPQNQPQNAQ